MPKYVLAAISLLCAGCTQSDMTAVEAGPDAPPIQTGTIVVNVEGFLDNRGTARLQLFDSAQRWPRNPMRTEMRPIRQRSARFDLDGVPFGEYAIFVWQAEEREARTPLDLHGNSPRLPIAFSNDAETAPGQRGPPSFDEVKFPLDQTKVEITLNVVNPNRFRRP